jgi:uncharacterized protein YcbK (DUF882 family)
MTTRRFIFKLAAGLLAFFGWFTFSAAHSAADGQRFFHSGDGRIHLVSEKNGRVFDGAYWRAAGGYDPTALKAIHRVFDAPYDPAALTVSLRLIAFLDFLQDRLQPNAQLTITSGYRSPEYNRNVRARGGLAAKASLHQYGMAADIVMAGVPSERLWETVKALGFGGTGYYHGRTVHLDVGPARFWDEKTSGVGTGLSDDNKLIELVTDYDIYQPGDSLTLRFIRMTAFPIGVVPVFFLEGRREGRQAAKAIAFEPVSGFPTENRCPQFDTIDQMAGIRWKLPADLPPGRYAVRARFCEPVWEGMPAEAATPVFEVAAP